MHGTEVNIALPILLYQAPTVTHCFSCSHDEQIVDDIFRTCCVLHNRLIKEDGLDEGWLRPEDSNFDDDDFWAVATGRMLQRQRMRAEGTLQSFRSLDLSGLGPGPALPKQFYALHHEGNVEDDDDDAVGGALQYNKKADTDMHFSRRECLIEHYSVLFKQNKIVWPTRWKGPRA